MKKFYTIILAALLLAPCASAQTDCEILRDQNGWPMHYCDCQNDHTKLMALPIDTTITDSIWFKSTLKVFINSGMTAYLYSETDVYFDIYQRCTTPKTLLDTVIKQNRAFEIDGEALQQKLAENGQSNANMAIYVCIHPAEEDKSSRVLCYPYGQGPASTCEDILPIVPAMTFVSSHPEDVYELPTTIMPEKGEMRVEWFNHTGACLLKVTRGTCDGEVELEAGLNEPYILHNELLQKARENGENLYLHFIHAEGTTGRVQVDRIDYIDLYTDTTICQGNGLQLTDTLLTETTIYPYDTIQQDANLFHVLNYRLTISEPEVQHLTAVACDSYDWNGMTYTTSGDYNYWTSTEAGCDSIVTLHLTINQSERVEEMVVACDSYDWNGMTYTASGDYVYTTTAANGCDSIVTLHLTINQPKETEETIAACNSYQWNGKTYTTSGDYVYTTTTVNGCDSVVTLHLTINYSGESEETVMACDSYEWNGKTYTESGDYIYTTTTVHGCDSVAILYLTIEKSETVEETVVACNSYEWNGMTYTTSGDYTYITTADNGCDRTEILHLTIDTCSDVEEVHTPSAEVHKVLQGNRILILRGGKTYDLLGQVAVRY